MLDSALENTSKFVLAVAIDPTDAKLSALVKNTEGALPPSVPAFKFAESTAILISVAVLEVVKPVPTVKLLNCKLPELI